MKKEKKPSPIIRLLGYAGNYKKLTVAGLFLSAVSMILGMLPYICIWLVVRDLISVAPNWTQANNIVSYGWMAFAFAVGGILIYFLALMCTHLAAFRTASNIRKQGMAHLMKTPLGFFDNNASGFLRNRLDGAAGETETLLAHNLADIVGTIAMFIAMIVLMFVFDWRMGCACVFAAIISVVSMFTMMGGKNAKLMMEYQTAQDTMSKAGTEYVRGIPVVKVFQQTIYSFKAFKQAIDDYSTKAERYTGGVCRFPQSLNLTFTEGAFVFLIPLILFIAPSAIKSGNIGELITNFAFYAVFSAIISTALARIMFAASGSMLANTALNRIDEVMKAPLLEEAINSKQPKDNSVEFKNVSFTYEGALQPALDNISFKIEPGQTVAFVGPSGSGKSTCAKLSGGERQRISIARALLKDAPIVLLDEATASLDVENETKVQGALSRLLKNKTVVVIAHRMRTVEAADKIVVLEDGKVVEQGSPKQLNQKKDSIFKKMAQLQSQSEVWSV